MASILHGDWVYLKWQDPSDKTFSYIFVPDDESAYRLTDIKDVAQVFQIRLVRYDNHPTIPLPYQQSRFMLIRRGTLHCPLPTVLPFAFSGLPATDKSTFLGPESGTFDLAVSNTEAHNPRPGDPILEDYTLFIFRQDRNKFGGLEMHRMFLKVGGSPRIEVEDITPDSLQPEYGLGYDFAFEKVFS